MRTRGTASYGFTPPEALVHVDIDADVLSRNFRARVAIAADASAFLIALLPRLRGRAADASREIAEGHATVQPSIDNLSERIAALHRLVEERTRDRHDTD